MASNDNGNNNLPLVNPVEQEQIARSILTWLNTYSDKPAKVNYEYLPKDDIGIAMASTQAAYIVQSYVDGTYEARYPFSLIYRCQPSNSNDRLSAEEVLNKFGKWAENATHPALGEGKAVTEIKRDTTSTLLARYEDGTEDYQIQLIFNYEVNS